MIATTTELVPYSRATEIATKYTGLTADIRRLILELGEKVAALKEAFRFDDIRSYDFCLNLEMSRESYNLDSKGADAVLKEFKRSAWKILIEKLEIRKLMSQREAEQLDTQLNGRQRGSFHSEVVPELPEIDADTIISVMSGMILSAPDYLTDKIREVYQWLIPYRWEGGHKTNKRDRIGKKVIKGYSVEIGFRSKGYRVKYDRQKDLTALDFIFHALDGAGIPPGHYGPLVDAINASAEGVGETEYFRFKCFKNGNLHLEFKKIDLLDRFNAVAVDGHRIGGEAARR